MKLKEIISVLEAVEITGAADLEVGGITFDSRNVKPGDLFVAIRGTGADGHDFIDQALSGGAAVVVSEEDPQEGDAGIFRQFFESNLLLCR